MSTTYPLPDLHTLRDTCDGATLTRAAWTLGLAPTSVEVIDLWTIDRREDSYWDCQQQCWWTPHLTLAQADAVWRRLRDQGWMLSNSWVPQRPPGRQGYLEAIKGGLHIGIHYTPTEEACALVRCAVLALVTAQEGTNHHAEQS